MASLPFKVLRQVSNRHFTKSISCVTRCYSKTLPCKKTTTNTNNAVPHPPEIKIDPTKGSSILHQKAARAAQLHAELNALLDAQAQRRAEEMNRGFGSGFIDFMRSSKSEMINIFAAFACVVLAWQVAGFRKGAQRLIDEAVEKDAVMEELKDILRVLSSEDFCRKASIEYYSRLKEGKEQRSDTSKRGRLFGLMAKSEKDASEMDDDDELLHSIFRKNLQNLIGNSALSDSELEEKKIFDLKSPTPDSRMDPNGNLSHGDLEQMFVEAQQDQGDNKNTIAKSRTGFI